MGREACVCDHGFERSDLCAEIIIIIIISHILCFFQYLNGGVFYGGTGLPSHFSTLRCHITFCLFNAAATSRPPRSHIATKS